MKVSFLSLLLLTLSMMSLSTSSQADSPDFIGGQMVFALGYGTPGQSINNYVFIGNYIFTERSITAEYKEFDANANLKPKKANLRHNLEAPYGKRTCQNKIVDMPSESAERSVKGTWEMNGNLLKLTINAHTQEWEAADVAEGGYKLRSIKDNTLNEDLPLAVGFAYLSKSEITPIKINNFLSYYRGDIFHKNNRAVANTPWELGSSGLKVSVFSASDDGDLLLYSAPGLVENKGMWVANGMLLNHNKKLANTIYQDLGHDFNKNGCYDEFGHTKIILAAYDGNKPLLIRNMVYIEYSYAFDGFPLLSVGRYYR